MRRHDAAEPKAVAVTDLDRLLSEQWPTGTFGGPKPPPAPKAPEVDPRAAEHCRLLLAELRARSGLRKPGSRVA